MLLFADALITILTPFNFLVSPNVISSAKFEVLTISNVLAFISPLALILFEAVISPKSLIGLVALPILIG